jgi:hypothetical protein
LVLLLPCTALTVVSEAACSTVVDIREVKLAAVDRGAKAVAAFWRTVFWKGLCMVRL